MIITVYKPVGMTCGELIKTLPYEYATYVGILDPMAHGLLTILVNSDVHNMKEHMKHNKTYKFRFIVGPNTDTDDILGIQVLDSKSKNINLKEVIEYINNFPQQYKQKYHVFSSYKPKKRFTDGKRKHLWWWTSNGYEIQDIPERTVKIYKKKIDKLETVTGEKMKEEFLYKLSLLKTDKFRKGEIIKQWEEYEFDKSYNVFYCTLSVSSGFYIRQFVKDMSDKLGVKMLVTDIERTEISE
jgi:tRNA pseudouridine(55) synthase